MPPVFKGGIKLPHLSVTEESKFSFQFFPNASVESCEQFSLADSSLTDNDADGSQRLIPACRAGGR